MINWIDRNVDGSGIISAIALLLLCWGVAGMFSHEQIKEIHAQKHGLLKIKIEGYVSREDAKLIYSKVK